MAKVVRFKEFEELKTEQSKQTQEEKSYAKRMTIELTPEQHQTLRVLSAQNGMQMSQFIRYMIENWEGKKS